MKTMSFKWVTPELLDKMSEFAKKIITKDEGLYQDGPAAYKQKIDGELEEFYSPCDYGIIVLDKKAIGVVSYYSHFLNKKDIWVGWVCVDNDLDSDNKLEKLSFKMLEEFIKKKFPEKDYLRLYDIKGCAYEKEYESLGYICENIPFKDKGSGQDVVVWSKCLKDNIELKHWTKKPVW